QASKENPWTGRAKVRAAAQAATKSANTDSLSRVANVTWYTWRGRDTRPLRSAACPRRPQASLSIREAWPKAVSGGIGDRPEPMSDCGSRLQPRRGALQQLAAPHLQGALGRHERIGPGRGPEGPEHGVLGDAVEQFAWREEAVQRRQRAHLGWRDATQDVLGAELGRVFEAGRAEHVAQRTQRVLVEVEHPRGLVLHVERAPARRVLGGDAGRAQVGVAAARLDAAEREHEPAPGIAPVRAHCDGARDFEGAGDP